MDCPVRLAVSASVKSTPRTRRITGVWLALLAATALSWAIGQNIALPGAHAAGIAIVFIAFLKIRYVILDFMEIRNAPTAMRIAAECWVVIVFATITLIYTI
jgi:Prokaryotic Cytochrome C oxidase subunit IV